MAQMTQITTKAFATEDTEITENSKGIGFRGNSHSPACERGVFLVRRQMHPAFTGGAVGSAMANRKTKPKSSSILPILQMRSTQPGAL